MADTEYSDGINDIVYCSEEKRVAVCSNDMSVEIWEKAMSVPGQKRTEWFPITSWKAHSKPIRRATWAPRKYGTVLATCSCDGTVAVWVEKITNAKINLKMWTLKTYFHDTRAAITDVKFAPERFGLILATCSSDGIIRFYEALDEKNVDKWIMQLDMPYYLSLSSLSWTLAITRFNSALLAAGSDNKSSGEAKVIILQYIEERFLWETATTIPGVTDPVHDVAFANISGRRYYVLAVATKNVRLYHMKYLHLDHFERNTPSKFSIELCAQFDVHHCTVLRVGWSVPATILSAITNDGIVHTWECSSYYEINDQNKWNIIKEIEVGRSSIPSGLTFKALASSMGVMSTAILTGGKVILKWLIKQKEKELLKSE